ncbi:MAG: zinc ribbon domain-containing protein [Planctomycetota bacterium]|nr:zinc ribbon domain-containing protein [Planctomycetota bacterium]
MKHSGLRHLLTTLPLATGATAVLLPLSFFTILLWYANVDAVFVGLCVFIVIIIPKPHGISVPAKFIASQFCTHGLCGRCGTPLDDRPVAPDGNRECPTCGHAWRPDRQATRSGSEPPKDDLCPGCGYLMVDLPSRRCPECGQLAAKATGAPMTLPRWDGCDDERTPVRVFLVRELHDRWEGSRLNSAIFDACCTHQLRYRLRVSGVVLLAGALGVGAVRLFAPGLPPGWWMVIAMSTFAGAVFPFLVPFPWRDRCDIALRRGVCPSCLTDLHTSGRRRGLMVRCAVCESAWLASRVKSSAR